MRLILSIILTMRLLPTPLRPLRSLVVAIALAATACGSSSTLVEPAADSNPTIVATTGVWADVTSALDCNDEARIAALIPPGGDPHAFEPSLADRGELEGASLVVANGLGLEEGLDDTIASVEDGGTPVFRVGEHLDVIDADHDSGADHDDDTPDGESEHDTHAHDGADPHVWLDPVRVSQALPDLAAALVDQAGLDADQVDQCLVAYREELAALDAEIQAMVDEIPRSDRKLVTNHDSLAYFADRYGFEVIGTVIPSTSSLAEPSTAGLEELAAVVEESGVPAIFAEAQESSDVATALADRIDDVEVVTLYTGSLGEPGSGADTYVGFLRSNAALITAALS